MNTRTASIYMICGAVLWGTNPALIKLAAWHPLGTAWLRGGFCAAVLLTYIIFGKRLSLRSWGTQFWCGFFLAANSVFFVAASTYTTPANAVVLMFTFPWITIALDYLSRGIKPLRGDILRLFIGLCGIAIIVGGGFSGSGSRGDIFALMSGVSIALHIFFSQKLSLRHGGNHEILTAILFAWVLSFIVFLPLIIPLHLLSDTLASLPSVLPSISWSLPNVAWPRAEQWPYLVSFGLLSALPWLLWGKAIAHISGHVIAALLGIEVFTAALLGWLALGEIPSIYTWLGGGLTLVAAASQIIFGNPKRALDSAVATDAPAPLGEHGMLQQGVVVATEGVVNHAGVKQVKP